MNNTATPIDLDNLIDEPDFANELLDAANELRAAGMVSLAAAVERAHLHLGFADAPPASGTFAVNDSGARLVPRFSVGV